MDEKQEGRKAKENRDKEKKEKRMGIKETLEQALEHVYGGIITPLDDFQTEDIETLYRMPIEGVLGTVIEMLLTDNRELYKAVNSYHLARSQKSSRENFL